MRTALKTPSPAKGMAQADTSHKSLINDRPQINPLWNTFALHAQTKLAVSKPDDPYEREADSVADQVMRMPEPQVQRKFSACSDASNPIDDELGQPKVHRRAEPSAKSGEAIGNFSSTLGSGRPLDTSTRAFFEPRFGKNFGDVRIHADGAADASASSVNALAYTLGRNVVFRSGQYAPNSDQGRRLLAHELVHVVQQENGVQSNVIQRRSGCSTSQDSSITADHARARSMLSTAIATVSSYNGTTPAKVHTALARHFHGATSNAFATWINVNLRFLWATTWMAGYECYTGGLLERTWACEPGAFATTFWCVPGMDIRLCPSYFGQSPKERSTTMIHEWVHKYGCNFDLGYEGEADYPKNWTVTQLLNADSFANFVRDVS